MCARHPPSPGPGRLKLAHPARRRRRPPHPTPNRTAQNNNNNYARPGGQNTGNFLTEKNSSRVLAPPGGKSQIFFG